MRHLYSAIFVCFIFLGACTQENKNTFEDIKIKNALCQNITLQQMDMHYLLGNPSKLCIKDSLLFISDFIKGKFITVYNLANKDSLFSTLHEGRGPNEVIGPIDVSFSENNLVVLDRQKSSIQTFFLWTFLLKILYFARHIYNFLLEQIGVYIYRVILVISLAVFSKMAF